MDEAADTIIDVEPIYEVTDAGADYLASHELAGAPDDANG
jgi:hypothetical protein